MTASDAGAARRKFLLIVLMPALAIGAAWLVFYTGVGIPKGTTNRGQLVQPPQQIGDLPLFNLAGEPITQSQLADFLNQAFGTSRGRVTGTSPIFLVLKYGLCLSGKSGDVQAMQGNPPRVQLPVRPNHSRSL